MVNVGTAPAKDASCDPASLHGSCLRLCGFGMLAHIPALVTVAAQMACGYARLMPSQQQRDTNPCLPLGSKSVAATTAIYR